MNRISHTAKAESWNTPEMKWWGRSHYWQWIMERTGCLDQCQEFNTNLVNWVTKPATKSDLAHLWDQEHSRYQWVCGWWLFITRLFASRKRWDWELPCLVTGTLGEGSRVPRGKRGRGRDRGPDEIPRHRCAVTCPPDALPGVGREGAGASGSPAGPEQTSWNG